MGAGRAVDPREVGIAILRLASSGRRWRAMPKGAPPMATVEGHFHARRDIALFGAVTRLPVVGAHELKEREVRPTAGVIDSETRENR